jgi:hypothetical protein
MPLNIEERRQLYEALLAAFLKPEDLLKMLRLRLDGRAAAEVGGASLSELVENLIGWAQAQGQERELMLGAYAERPGNQRLREFVEQMNVVQAFLPGYRYDVWVSAADDVELAWLARLTDDLKTRLTRSLDQPVAATRSWPAEGLSADSLAERAQQAVQRSAIFVAVLSEQYLNCARCRRERQLFQEAHAADGGLMRRLFVVEYEPVDRAAFPPEFHEVLPLRFSGGEEKYYDALLDLGERLVELLKTLKSLAVAGVDPPGDSDKPDGPGGPDYWKTVFLAEVPEGDPDLEDTRDDVRRYLEQQRVRVLPEKYYPRDPDEFQARMDRDLEACDLFAQMLGRRPPRSTEDLPGGYVGLQFERAQKSGKPLLQWRNSGVDLADVRDEGYRRFLDGPRVQADSLESFKKAVIDALRRPEPPTHSDGEVGALVFVNYDPQDEGWTVQEVLPPLRAKGFDLVRPLPLTETAEDRDQWLEQRLRDCDALFVIYGVAKQAWVFEQLMRCRRVLARRERPLRAWVLTNGPPEKPPLAFSIGKLQYVDCQRDTAALREFLDKLGAGGAP